MLVRLSNEWMRRYIDEPDRFEQEFRTVIEFIRDEAQGREPSYGERCVGYLLHLMAEERSKTKRRSRRKR